MPVGIAVGTNPFHFTGFSRLWIGAYSKMALGGYGKVACAVLVIL